MNEVGFYKLRYVLVMDDALFMQEQYRRLFDEKILAEQYRCRFARDKTEVLSIIKSHKPDLALLDLRGKDDDRHGLETALILRKVYPEMPVTIMTITDVDNTSVALEAVSKGFQFIEKSLILKPQTARILLDLLFLEEDLPLPRIIRDFLIAKYRQDTPLVDKSIEKPKFELSDTERQVAFWYRDAPNETETEVAVRLRKDPETLRKAASRLRTKLRDRGFVIRGDLNGRSDVIQALHDLKVSGFV